MAKMHGSKAFFKIGSTSFVGYIRTVSLNRSGEAVDVTTLTLTDKTYIGGLKDATISFEGVFEPAADAALDAALAVLSTFEIGPQGSGSGAVKWSGSAILTRYNPNFSVSDAGKFTGEMQVSGGVTVGTYA